MSSSDLFFPNVDTLIWNYRGQCFQETMINHQGHFQLHRNTRKTIDVNEFSRNHLESETLYVNAFGSSPN
jgi:hypothetical protein